MRIWMINQYALPPTEVGHTRHYYLAKALQKRGHDVLVISSNFNHFSGKFIDGISKTTSELTIQDEVPFLWLPVPNYTGNSLGRIKNMFGFALRLIQPKHFSKLEKPDVIIGSSPQPFAAFGAYLLAKRLNTKYVLEIRDLWPESLIDLGKLSTKHPIVLLVRRMVNHLYKKSTKIISLLPNSIDYLVSLGVHRDKIIWAPNFVNQIVPVDESAERHGPFTIMYAGSHGIANGLDCVIHAAELLVKKGLTDKIRFVLIGHGAEKFRLQQYAIENNLTNIEFKDVIPKTEIFSVMNGANAFLMLLQDSPVFQYGISPNKLFDYLALGKPVICNIKAKFHRDDLDAGMIYVDPKDPEALANAAIELADLDKDSLKVLGAKGREIVDEYFTVDQVAKMVESAL